MPESQAWCARETLEVNKKENEEKQNGTRLNELIEGEQPENDKNFKKEKKLKNLLKSKKLLAALAISASLAVILPLAVSAYSNQGTVSTFLLGKPATYISRVLPLLIPLFRQPQRIITPPKAPPFSPPPIFWPMTPATAEMHCCIKTRISPWLPVRPQPPPGSGVNGLTQAQDETANVIARDGVVIIVNTLRTC